MYQIVSANVTEVTPSPYLPILYVQIVDINVFAKSDEIPLLCVQDIKEKTKCRVLTIYELQRAITLTELAPYFSIINVHLVDIEMFVKFDEIP